jgi:hypothetical protein
MSTPAVMPTPGAYGITPTSGGYAVCVSLFVAVLILIILILVFRAQIDYLIRGSLATLSGTIRPKDRVKMVYAGLPEDNDWDERLTQPAAAGTGGSTLPAGQTSDTLLALGYTNTVPWDEVIQATELDPSTHVNHMEFVEGVRRFSSGANFADIAGDNNSFAFSNFRGLRRPEHVEIGSSARQQPDIDEDVLKRNKPFIFN